MSLNVLLLQEGCIDHNVQYGDAQSLINVE